MGLKKLCDQPSRMELTITVLPVSNIIGTWSPNRDHQATLGISNQPNLPTMIWNVLFTYQHMHVCVNVYCVYIYIQLDTHILLYCELIMYDHKLLLTIHLYFYMLHKHVYVYLYSRYISIYTWLRLSLKKIWEPL